MTRMKRKYISLILSVAALIGIFNIPINAAKESNIYKASEAWNTEQSGNEVWKWESYTDMGETYQELTVYNEVRGRFGMDPQNPVNENVPTAPGWCGGSAWNFAAVGQYWMIPLIKTTGTTAEIRKQYGVCRSFTAPKSGNVTLSTEDGNIYGGAKQSGAGNTTAYVRITVNGRQIWPEDGELQIPYDKAVIQTYKFEPVTEEINEGDVVRFEVYNGDGDNGYGKYVYWAPVVTYNYLPESIEPAELDNVFEDQLFTLTFPDELEAMTADNIEVSSEKGSASVKRFSQSDDGRSISFSFEGLKGETVYSVSISGIKILGEETEYSYTFSFTTGEIFEAPVYMSDAAWSDESNNDAVWKWLYKNNATKDTLTPYVYYELTAKNNSNEFIAPAKNEDGSYNYLTIGETTDTTRIFCDSQTNAYARNSLSRYWIRPAIATQSEPMQSRDNRIVKEFTAPQTGKISIFASDMSGDSKIYARRAGASNIYGALLRIIKKSEDGTENELWTHTFEFSLSETEPRAVIPYDFETIDAEIKKGERLWFEVSAETGGSAYAKQVFWNPVVSYETVHPNITEMTPKKNAEGLAPNFEQKITFDYRIRPVEIADIEIDGGASVKSASLENDDSTLCISFSGLKPYTNYNVKLHNIQIFNAPNENDVVYEFSFATGAAVQFGEIYISGGGLHSGSNTVCADINNSEGEVSPFSAALMAIVCKGTEESYEIVSAKRIFRRDIGENDVLSVQLDVSDTNGYFIKALLLESPSSARALLPIRIFK